jgi:hypothetical protein
MIPVARILQSLLPEGYNITTNIPGLPPTPAGFDAADGPPPRPEYPHPREATETEEAFMARMDRHYRLHAMYLQEYQGYELRMRTRQHVRSSAIGSEKNIRKISDCTKDTSLSDWLRATQLNLVARNVRNEAEQVKQASSYLYSALQRRWIIARDKAILEGKLITWRFFANQLLTGIDGVQPAEHALRALHNYTVQSSKTSSANLYHFQKLLDTCEDCLPGTKYQMPSGYELCTLFIDRVVKHLPKDISNTLIDRHVAETTQQEQLDFFLGNKVTIDDWYKEQMQTMLLQGIAKANALPKTQTAEPRGLFAKEPKGLGANGSKFPPRKGGVQKINGKRPREDSKGRQAELQKPKNNKFGEFIDSLKSNAAVDQSKLYHEKGKCLFCGSTKHVAKDCRVNMQTRFGDDPVRLKNNSLARDLAGKFFKK